MKKIFIKFLLPLSVVGLLISCNKEPIVSSMDNLIKIYINENNTKREVEVKENSLVKDLFDFAPENLSYLNFYNDEKMYEKINVYDAIEPEKEYYVLTESKNITLINTIDDFFKIESNGNYKLNSDLDFNGKSVDLGFNYDKPFNGYFNGNGFKISNFSLPDKEYSALFGYVKGTIYNLNVSNNMEINCNNSKYISPLVGYLHGGVIRECMVDGKVNVISNVKLGSTYLGGINSRNELGQIILSTNRASLSLSTNLDAFVGGISAYNGGGNALDGIIDYCLSYANNMTSISTAKNSSSYVGGISGFNFGKISHSVSSINNISGRSNEYQSYVGGLVGDNNGGYITHTLSTSNLNNISGKGYTFTGNVIGRNFKSSLNNLSGKADLSYGYDHQALKSTNGDIYSLNEKLYLDSLSYEEIIDSKLYDKLELSRVFILKEGYLPSLDSSFKKIDNNNQFKLIKSASDFENIKNGLDAKYVLENDIVLDGENFSPIGTYINPFNGYFDGNNKTITINIKSLNSTNFLGIFGYLNGVVKNLSIVFSVNVEVKNNNVFCGSLSGYATKALIRNVHSKVDINIKSDGISLGGLLGVNEDGYVIDSSVNGKINGTINDIDSYLGGLIGKNNGSVTTSFFKGDIITTGGEELFIGGLVGKNNLDIESSYAHSNIISKEVTSLKSIGGIAGSNYDLGLIKNCYSISEILNVKEASINLIGGFVGDNLKMIENCYYLVNEDIKYSAGESLEFMKIKRVDDDELKTLASSISNVFKDGKDGYPVLNYEKE